MKRPTGWKQRRAAINKARGWTKRNPVRCVWLNGKRIRIDTTSRTWILNGTMVDEYAQCLSDMRTSDSRMVAALARTQPRRLRKVERPIVGQYMVGPVNAWRDEPDRRYLAPTRWITKEQYIAENEP